MKSRSKRLRSVTKSAAWLIALLGLPVADALKPQEAAEVQARVDQWIAPYLAAGDFSGVVFIAQGNRVLAQKAYGTADLKRQTPNTVAMRFRIASLSKTFTASAIELLLQQGKLKLDDKIATFVPGIAYGDRMTLRLLLRHESGVGRVEDPDKFRDCLTAEELLRRLKTAKPLFEPGKGEQYSNEGYFLLALVIEKVSGESYENFLQRNFFTPLAMKSTGSTCKQLPPGPNATGNVPGAVAAMVVPMEENEAVEIGPGSIFSTAGDLYAWLRAVDTNPKFQTGRWEYPYGWGKRNYSGHTLIEQSGILEGFNAHMALYPGEHIYAVVLSNVQSGFSNRIPKDLEAVLFGGEFSEPPPLTAVTVSVDQFADYTGEYTTEAGPFHQTFFIHDGNLAMRWESYPFPRALVPTGKDEFFLRYEYATVRFARDSSGKVTGVSWDWGNGKPIEFRKLVKK